MSKKSKKLNPEQAHPDIDEVALTLNPVVGLSVEDLLRTGGKLLRQAMLQPAVALTQTSRLWEEWVRILAGTSDIELDPKDRRFSDPAFKDKPGYRTAARGWLAWQKAVQDWVDCAGFNQIDRERAEFLAGVVTDAFAPTNFLLGNPSAVQKAIDSKGESLVKGLKNFIEDLRFNHGMPSQVDKSAFKVGENLATTPGAVVHRHPILELIQYQPKTKRVQARPVFIVPPQINKFYVYDMSPDKSLVKYLVSEGFQVFMVSWRNPTAEQRDWGLADYIDALNEAIDVTLQITGQDAVNGIGACAGGITFATALGYFAGKRDLAKVSSLTLMVNVLETKTNDSVMGLFATEETIEAARKRSARQGVLDGNDTARVFNWMRPNDLIWNYVASNYLHGEDPPAFDILYWNNDTTRLPARLHSDFLEIFSDNPLSKHGAMKIHDVPIDLAEVTCPVFITGGTTDHITPWEACYRSTQLFGGEKIYLLSTAGHIQSLINPPGKSKRKFYTNPELPESPQEWLKNVEEHSGSWWPYWAEQLKEWSRGEVDAAKELGSKAHPIICQAPGTYVLG